jgi:hypothetical protein
VDEGEEVSAGEAWMLLTLCILGGYILYAMVDSDE